MKRFLVVILQASTMMLALTLVFHALIKRSVFKPFQQRKTIHISGMSHFM